MSLLCFPLFEENLVALVRLSAYQALLLSAQVADTKMLPNQMHKGMWGKEQSQRATLRQLGGYAYLSLELPYASESGRDCIPMVLLTRAK